MPQKPNKSKGRSVGYGEYGHAPYSHSTVQRYASKRTRVFRSLGLLTTPMPRQSKPSWGQGLGGEICQAIGTWSSPPPNQPQTYRGPSFVKLREAEEARLEAFSGAVAGRSKSCCREAKRLDTANNN